MDTRIPVTISLGISSQKGAEVSQITNLIAESDKLLYVAKGNGKNQVAV
jgi:PleD family two-component response regulator